MRSLVLLFVLLQMGCSAQEGLEAKAERKSERKEMPPFSQKSFFINTIHPHLSQTLADQAVPYDPKILSEFEKAVQPFNDDPKLSNGVCYRMDFRQGKFILPGPEAFFHGDKTEDFNGFLNHWVADHLQPDKDFHVYFSTADGGAMIQPEIRSRFHPKDIPYLFVEVPLDYYKEYSEHIHLLPDVYLIRAGYQNSVRRIQEAKLQKPYGAREDIAFWRGSQFGINWQIFDLENMDTAIRHKLVLKSLQEPELLNARFKAYQYGHLEVETESQRSYQRALQYLFGSNPERYNLPVVDYMTRARYLLHVDGASASYERPFLIMHGGSVLLYTSQWVQFFNPLIQDEVHYLDIGSDLSKLETQIARLRADPELAAMLIDNANDFVTQMTERYFGEIYLSAFQDMQARF